MSNELEFQARRDAVANGPLGRNLRAEFDARWHLKDLNVVDDLTTFASDAWDRAETKLADGEEGPLVVVMDTPLDADHPNLEGRIQTALMRDFSVLNDGVFPVRSKDLTDGEFRQRLSLIKTLEASTPDRPTNAQIAALVNTDWANDNPEDADVILADLLDETETPSPDNAVVNPTPSVARHNFAKYVPGAHGTAVAGLIAGNPVTRPVQRPVSLGDTITPSTHEDVHLSYAGINPYARIVPVSLTAAPYPDMVLGALTYIQSLNPDVVVVAAAWADGRDLEPDPFSEDDTWSMFQNEQDIDFSGGDGVSPPDKDIWDAVTEKISAISKSSVVLCAAGNVDSTQLVYPARLCAEPENHNRIWAVTACNEISEELSYAPDVNENWRMIKTLSTQLPRSDRDETVVDNFEYVQAELRRDISGYTPVTPRDVITLDPTGRQGYNPTDTPSVSGAEDEPLLEIGSLFARFSGTSAASAVAGGLVSLALMTPNAGSNGETGNPSVLFDLDQARLFFKPS